MFDTLLSVLSLLVALAAFLPVFRDTERRPLNVRLCYLGTLALAAGIVARVLIGIAGAAAVSTLGLILIAALWAATSVIVRLCLIGIRRVGQVLIAIGVAGAVVTSAVLSGAWLPAVLLLPLTLRTVWLDRDASTRFRFALFGASVAFLWAALHMAERMPDLPAVQETLVRLGVACVGSFAFVLAVKLAFGTPVRVFRRMRLRSRLLISYMLVAGTPVILAIAFLLTLSLMTMGSYRAGLVAHLLEPGERLRTAVGEAINSPEVTAALTASTGSQDVLFDSAARHHLRGAEEGAFLIAGRTEPADTSSATVVAGPVGVAPEEAKALRQLTPPFPYTGFLLVGRGLYSTYGERRTSEDHERVLQVFRPIDRSVLASVGDLTETDILCILPDTLRVDPAGGVTIRWKGDRPSAVMQIASGDTTGSVRSGFFFGVQGVTTWRMDGGPKLSTAAGVLLVRTQWQRLLASITDTVRNPFNQAICGVLIVIAVLFCLVELAAAWMGGNIARNIHRAVVQLTRGTRRLAADDFDHRIEIERADELGELGRAFNAMAEGLKERRRLAVERERMRSEMRVAHDIQQRLLPASVPAVPGLDLAGVSIPSREVGGDAYDMMAWGDDKLAVSIADVGGKGVPAALLMSNLQAAIRSHALRPSPLDEVMGELNKLVVATTDPGRFITCFLGIIDPREGSLTFANAGHDPPLIVRTGGSIDDLTEGGLLLGAVPGATYQETRRQLRPGEVLVLYTDGVTEAERQEDDFFERERLCELLSEGCDGQPAAVIRDRIVAAVREFLGGSDLSDDLTVVVVRYLGGSSTLAV